MLQGLTGWHFLIILAVILLLFGAAKLPSLAKSMGQSARVFKGEMKAMKAEGAEGAGAVADPADGILVAAAGGTHRERLIRPGRRTDVFSDLA